MIRSSKKNPEFLEQIFAKYCCCDLDHVHLHCACEKRKKKFIFLNAIHSSDVWFRNFSA